MTDPINSRDPYQEQEDGDRALWCAVIYQALNDALGTPSRARSMAAHNREIAQARAWLLNGERDFREVCTLAGLDPDAVQERARQAIERGTPLEGRGGPKPKPEAHQPRTITYQGQTLTIDAWSQRTGIPAPLIRWRLDHDWGVERTLTTQPLTRWKRTTFAEAA